MEFFKNPTGSWKLGRNESMSSGKCTLIKELDGTYSIRLLSGNMRQLFNGKPSDLVRENGTPYETLEDLKNECDDFFADAAQGAAANVTALTGRVEYLEAHAYDTLWIDYWQAVAPVNPISGDVWFNDVDTIKSWLTDHWSTPIPISFYKFYIKRQAGNASFAWSGNAMVATSQPLVFVTQAEVEVVDPIENTKIATILRVFQGFKYWLANVNFAALTTTAKTVVGAIVELKSLVYLRATIAGLFNYPIRTLALPAFDIDMTAAEDFTKLTGMGNNQAFTISNPIIKKKCRLYLTGGTLAVPTFTGYTVSWVGGSLVTDYVPTITNILYLEIRSAGIITAFWGV